MSESSLDINAYLKRIGLTEGVHLAPKATDDDKASLQWAHSLPRDKNTLDLLSLHHVCSIPFENTAVLKGEGVDISSDALFQKLVHDKRGGYCFEQNQLLLDVLLHLGFDAHALSARVRWQSPRTFVPPRTHLFIRVDLKNESRLVDVGVGSCSLSASLRFEENTVQQTPHDQRRLLREGDTWFHQVRFSDDQPWHDVLEFSGESMPRIDREMANWYTCTHPASKFKQMLIVALAEKNGTRHAIRHGVYTKRQKEKPATKRELQSKDEIEQVLKDVFKLSYRPE